MVSKKFTFITLVLVVGISGLSQGLTTPLLTILLNTWGVSPVANGFNATALYLGPLIISPFMEIPLRKYGYRSTILAGLLPVALASVLFPVLQSWTAWFVLRLVLGMGDIFLHYASQMWVTHLSEAGERGRNLSLYGLAFGIGFSIGPLGTYLLKFGVFVPFAAICLVYLVACAMLLQVKNAYPESLAEPETAQYRYVHVIRLGWLALIPSLLYGFMEATMNNSFPLYTLHLGLAKDLWPMLLASFTAGALILQLPLGALGDRVGRKKVMLLCAALGGGLFCLVPLSTSLWLIAVLFGLAGGLVGSFYSLGLAFAGDLLPLNLLPTAGIIMAMNYGLASILAPVLNGVILTYLAPGLMFVCLGCFLLLFTISGLAFHSRNSIYGLPIGRDKRI